MNIFYEEIMRHLLLGGTPASHFTPLEKSKNFFLKT